MHINHKLFSCNDLPSDSRWKSTAQKKKSLSSSEEFDDLPQAVGNKFKNKSKGNLKDWTETKKIMKAVTQTDHLPPPSRPGGHSALCQLSEWRKLEHDISSEVCLARLSSAFGYTQVHDESSITTGSITDMKCTQARQHLWYIIDVKKRGLQPCAWIKPAFIPSTFFIGFIYSKYVACTGSWFSNIFVRITATRCEILALFM